MLFKTLVWLFLGVAAAEAQAKPPPTLFYFLHQDADYLYYDRDNKKHYYWQDTVIEAQQNSALCNCEVYVFQLRANKFMRGGGLATLYRNGTKIESKSYKRFEKDDFFFHLEWAFYRQTSQTQNPDSEKILFYFGHHLPDREVKNYNYSKPTRSFSFQDFTNGIHAFGGYSQSKKPFSLIVLSTCSNGTPYTVKNLGMYSDHVIASPAALHLSMIRTQFADSSVQGVFDIEDYIKYIMDSSFSSLQTETETEITLSWYSIDTIKRDLADYLTDIENYKNPNLQNFRRWYNIIKSNKPFEYKDCAVFQKAGTPLTAPLPKVYVLYRAHRLLGGPEQHTGWACPYLN